MDNRRTGQKRLDADTAADLLYASSLPMTLPKNLWEWWTPYMENVICDVIENE